MKVRARATGVFQGERVYWSVELDINPRRIEPCFIPAEGERPAQDRVFARRYNPGLRYRVSEPVLVVHDSIEVIA